MGNPQFCWIVHNGYKSNLLKKFTFHSQVLNFSPSLKDSIQARHLQFGYLQIIVDLRMHYTIRRTGNYGNQVYNFDHQI